MLAAPRLHATIFYP